MDDKKVHELCNADEFEIYAVGSDYFIRPKGYDDEGKKLKAVLYQSFAKSAFVQISRQMRQAQIDFYNAKKYVSHQKQDLLQKALRFETEFDKQLKNLFNYVQKQLF